MEGLTNSVHPKSFRRLQVTATNGLDEYNGTIRRAHSQSNVIEEDGLCRPDLVPPASH